MALSQPRQNDRVDDALIDAAGANVTAAQLDTIKAEREVSRMAARGPLLSRMVRPHP